MEELKLSCSSKFLSTGHVILRALAEGESLDFAHLPMVSLDASTTLLSHQINTTSHQINTTAGAYENLTCKAITCKAVKESDHMFSCPSYMLLIRSLVNKMLASASVTTARLLLQQT